MQLAITREVSRSIDRCELTFLARAPIDLIRARQQHAQYEHALREAGLAVLALPEIPDLPDSVFVEDTALVLDECAIILRPGAASRLAEADSISELLTRFRKLHHIQAPVRADGGDILRLGNRIFVGVGQRTDEAAVEQIGAFVAPFGYSVKAVDVRGCLHLKSAVTEVGPGIVLVNPDWVDPGTFDAVTFIEIDPSEPYAANGLWLGATVLYPEAFPLTRLRLRQQGISTILVPADELAKAEGALTCGSLIFRA